jgi:hypothetical protein
MLLNAIKSTTFSAILLLLVACNSSKESTNGTQENQQDPRVTPHHTDVKESPTPQHPSDQPYVTVKGYQIPVFNTPTLEEAIEKAKIVLGPRSHGYLMWNQKIYNFDGKEVTLD